MTPPSGPASGAPVAGPFDSVHALLRSGRIPLDGVLGAVRARGPEAGKFLQGQLTQDVMAIAPGQGRLGALCTPKGRMIASFWILREDTECFWLLCSRALASDIAKRLAMFVLRAKLKVEDLSATVRIEADVSAAVEASKPDASADPDTEGDPGNDSTVDFTAELPELSLSTQALRVMFDDDSAAATLQRRIRVHDGAGNGGDGNAPPKSSPRPEQDWLLFEVLGAEARVTPQTRESFVPQMVNFELLDGVNFRKGCYTGQEVVARSQYLGKMKRRMALATLDSATPVHAGSDVFAEGRAEPVGIVVASIGVNNGNGANGDSTKRQFLLFESPRADQLDARLHVAGQDGAGLHLLELPYPIPETTA